MSLYRTVLKYRYQNQECRNRFYYNNAADDGSAVTLNILMLRIVLPDLANIMHDQCQMYELETVALDDPFDFNTLPFIENGNIAGEGLPAFVTSTYTLFPTRRDIRKGRKAFSGVSELIIADGGAIAAPYLTVINQVANVLQFQLPASTTDPNPSSLYDPALYRAPGGTLPTVLAPIGEASFRWFSTQNSRKVGRGI